MAVEFLVYACRADDITSLLKSPTAVIKKAFESNKKKPSVKEIKLRLPWLERIVAGLKAIDPDSDDDEDGVVESAEYFESYRWFCDYFMTPQPTGPMFVAQTIVMFDFYGYSECLRRFSCPFPLPKVDEPSRVAGFIPNAALKNFKLKPITKERFGQLMEFIKEIEKAEHNLDDGYTDEDYQLMDQQFKEMRLDVHHWMEAEGMIEPGKKTANVSSKRVMRQANQRLLDRLRRLVPIPSQDEIEIAHADFQEVVRDIHRSGLDLVGIIG